MPRSSRPVAVLALLLVLAACAGIPTDGPVRSGGDLQLVQEAPAVPIIAEPPQRGDSPVDIVRGFLRANADFSGDHETARRYLAPRARQAWRPEVGTTVYELSTPPQIEVVTTGDVVVRASQASRIDDEGSYRRAADGTMLERAFRLAEIDGQWRITSLEDGLLLSSVDVDEVFRELSLYFLSPTRNALVADPVLLPQQLLGMPTRLMSRLLRGPTSAMRGAVQSAFPQGTDLAVQSVVVEGGTAFVRLNDRALEADERGRERMSAQIVWTLKQLGPDIQRISVTVEGEDLLGAGPQPRDAWLTYDPDGGSGPTPAFAVQEGRVGRLQADGFEPLAGPLGDGTAPVRDPAVSLSGEPVQLAGVSLDGTRVLVSSPDAGAEAQAVAAGRDFSKPSWDALGNLWFVDRADSTMFVLPAGGTQPVPVELPEPLAGLVQTVAVSRDGARVAMVVGVGDAATTVLGSITGADLLASEGTPPGAVAISGAYAVLPDLSGVRDVAWSDATSVVTLGRQGEQLVSTPLYVSIDGYEIISLEPREQLVSLAAAPPPGPLTNPVIGATSRDRLFVYTSGQGWVPLGRGSDPTYPG